jgi:small subunit ribosomal protein S8
MVMDSIADMLTRIRNGLQAKKAEVLVPYSRMHQEIARILLEEGYISDCQVLKEGSHPTLRLRLKYDELSRPVIYGIRRISKSSRRVYVSRSELPKVLGGLGIAIISTPKGVLTDREARRQGVGGEVICEVW